MSGSTRCWPGYEEEQKALRVSVAEAEGLKRQDQLRRHRIKSRERLKHEKEAAAV